MGKGQVEGEEESRCAMCGTAVLCCFCILIGLTLLGLGIAKIAIGAVYLHECPMQRFIPIYLIVGGIVPFFFSYFCRGPDTESSIMMLPGQICGLVGVLFNVAWLISGTIWVYPNYAKVHSPSDDTVCNRVLYDFAFAMVTLDWLFDSLWIIWVIFLLVRIAIARSSVAAIST